LDDPFVVTRDGRIFASQGYKLKPGDMRVRPAKEGRR